MGFARQPGAFGEEDSAKILLEVIETRAADTADHAWKHIITCSRPLQTVWSSGKKAMVEMPIWT